MLDSKFIYTLIALFITMIGLYSYEPANKKLTEHFRSGVPMHGMIEKTERRITTVEKKKGVVTFSDEILPGFSHNKFDHPPEQSHSVVFNNYPTQDHGAQYNPVLPPRFSADGGFGTLRHDMPHTDNMGVLPSDPLGYANVVNENFDMYASVDDGPVDSPGADPVAGLDYPDTNDLVPMNDMRSVTQDVLNHDGDVSTSIIYDRQIYANKGSRLRGGGCPIRGDIPIKPQATGWFQVSATPHIDLHQGAMNVLAGVDNETSKSMVSLLNETSSTDTVGGVHLRPRNVAFDACGMDVSVV